MLRGEGANGLGLVNDAYGAILEFQIEEMFTVDE